MVIFHCYVSSPEGKRSIHWSLRFLHIQPSTMASLLCIKGLCRASKRKTGPKSGWYLAQEVSNQAPDLTLKFCKPCCLTGWWYTYPSEKYEFVSWDDYSQSMEKIDFKCSKPPSSFKIDQNAFKTWNHSPCPMAPICHLGLCFDHLCLVIGVWGRDIHRIYRRKKTTVDRGSNLGSASRNGCNWYVTRVNSVYCMGDFKFLRSISYMRIYMICGHTYVHIMFITCTLLPAWDAHPR